MSARETFGFQSAHAFLSLIVFDFSCQLTAIKYKQACKNKQACTQRKPNFSRRLGFIFVRDLSKIVIFIWWRLSNAINCILSWQLISFLPFLYGLDQYIYIYSTFSLTLMIPEYTKLWLPEQFFVSKKLINILAFCLIIPYAHFFHLRWIGTHSC